jgi:acetyl esterase/lipase
MPAQAIFRPRKLIKAAVWETPKLAVDLAARLQEHRRIVDMAYGAGPRRRLDVYLPANLAEPRAIIVYLYGGSWSSGEKEIYRFLGASLAARGFLAVIPDYRIYPAARFPAFVEDAAEALAWTRDQATRFGADPKSLFLMGHSAGAHIASMLAFEKRWLASVGLDSAADLAGIVGLAGPYHFEIDSDLLRGVFGPPENKALTQPIAHVSRDAPPLLLATGEADKTVTPCNTRNLAAAVRAAGGEVETIFYPRLGHREIIGAFSPLFGFLAPVADDVTAFVSTKSAGAANTGQSGGSERGPHEPVI